MEPIIDRYSASQRCDCNKDHQGEAIVRSGARVQSPQVYGAHKSNGEHHGCPGAECKHYLEPDSEDKFPHFLSYVIEDADASIGYPDIGVCIESGSSVSVMIDCAITFNH